MATDVYYNGVWLRNCLTRQFEQTVEYDESGTDRLFTRVNIVVEAIVAENLDSIFQTPTGFRTDNSGVSFPGFNSYNEGYCIGTHFAGALYGQNKAPEWYHPSQFGAGANGPDNTAPEKIRWVHGLLSVPRQEFLYYNNLILMLRAYNPNTNGPTGWAENEILQDQDLDNGPKPKFVNITQVLGSRAYRITFGIEICRLICKVPPYPTNDNAGELPGQEEWCGTATPEWANLWGSEKVNERINRALLSNRFSIDESRDDNFYVTRTLTGKARVRDPSMWRLGIRYLLLPGLPRGYQRVHQQFVTAPNGLDITYRVVDRQRYAAAPFPAVSFSGQHMEKTGIDGSHSHGVVQLVMNGGPTSSKKGLLAAAISIVEARIGQPSKKQPGQTTEHCIVRDVSVTDILNENSISLSVQFERHAEDEGEDKNHKWGNVFWNKLGLLPDVDTLLYQNGGNPRKDGEQYNRDQWPIPVPWDDGAPYGIFSQYLQDGCCPWHFTPHSTIPDDQDIDDTADYTPQSPEPATVSRAYVGDTKDEAAPPYRGPYERLEEEHIQMPYTVYEISSDYETDNGLVALPVASDEETTYRQNNCIISRIRTAVCRKTIFVSAKRVGGNPKFPSMKDSFVDENGIEYFLLEHHPEFKGARKMANGIDYEYEAHVRLVYLMSRPIGPSDKVTYGALPWDINGKSSHYADLSEQNQDERLL